jgi:hypothetical protein
MANSWFTFVVNVRKYPALNCEPAGGMLERHHVYTKVSKKFWACFDKILWKACIYLISYKTALF